MLTNGTSSHHLHGFSLISALHVYNLGFFFCFSQGPKFGLIPNEKNPNLQKKYFFFEDWIFIQSTHKLLIYGSAQLSILVNEKTN